MKSHKLYAINYSGYKGIHWDKPRRKWYVRTGIKEQSYFLGRFKDFDDAVEAREKVESAISLLRDVNAQNIHISSIKNDKVLTAILPKNGFNFKFSIQLDLPRTRDYSMTGGDL